MISFHLNDRTDTYLGSADRPLIRVLREDFGLTGTKQSCGIGKCGACMVLVNGRPTLSCRTKVKAVEGKRVLTVEGLCADALTAVQQALLEAGAVQCGYCTSGIVMSLTAMLERNPHPDEEDVVTALKPHLCRCTGYLQMIEAVERVLKGEVGKGIIPGSLGSSPLRTGGEALVSGGIRYAADLTAPQMLYGAVLWAQYPHAFIRRIETTKAASMPGVVAVFTAADIPGDNHYGKAAKDQPVLCGDRVRFIGDKVALVVAESESDADGSGNGVEGRRG